MVGSNLNFSPPIERSRMAAGFPNVRFGKVESPFDDKVAVPLKSLTAVVSESLEKAVFKLKKDVINKMVKTRILKFLEKYLQFIIIVNLIFEFAKEYEIQEIEEQFSKEKLLKK